MAVFSGQYVYVLGLKKIITRGIANIWNNTIEGKRPVGRPRSRWKAQVTKDVRRIKKDTSLANNRKEWRKLVDEAKTY